MLDSVYEFLRAHGLALAFAFYAAGVAFASGAPTAAFAVSAPALALVCAFLTPRRILYICLALVCVFAFGALVATGSLWRTNRLPYVNLNGHHIVVECVALERPRLAEEASLRARIVELRWPRTAAGASLRGAVAVVSFPGGQTGQVAGRRILVRGRLDLPDGPRNEGETAERNILADQGVSFTVVAHRTADIEVLGEASGWEAWWARARSSVAAAIERQMPALESTVLEGILWGDRGNLPADLRQEFSDTGTVHVLTTAGLHLGIMAGIVAWIVGLLPVARWLRVAAVLAGSWLFAALAGMHLPTVRAATMLSAGTAAFELGRGRTPSAVFAAAAFAVALPHPLVVLSPSFAMSFSCVVGIAIVNPILTHMGLREGCGLPRLAVEVLRTSLAVQIALWPLQALYFNALTPYAVLANAIVVPLIGVIMAAGSLFSFAGLLVPQLASLLGNITWWGLTLVIASVRFFASLPFAHVDVPPPSHVFLVAYWLALIAALLAVRSGVPKPKLGLAAAGLSSLLFLLYCVPGIEAALDRRLHVDAIDVGQADCILIRAPAMHAMLVDGGGRLERTSSGAVVAAPLGDRVATRVVMPFLLRHWVLHLDAVVLTHPHGDHAGGLPVILSRERAGALYDSAQMYSGPAYHRALDVVRSRHIPWVRTQRGVQFDLGPTTHVRVLAPEPPLITGTSSDINNNSIVLRLAFGRIAMLLTGDAQSEAEARLLSHGGSDLRADILKVGHHGSAYSSTPEFLAAVQPKVAIISCGLHNVFGHPSQRTLADLRTAGAAVYRTDLDGGVSIISNGLSIRVETMEHK